MSERQPDERIGGEGDNPYMLRWFLFPKNRWFNIYVHKFLRSDDDRALHDHPWWFISLILRGSYIERRISATDDNTRRTGSIALRPASTLHRIELIDNQPVWSLIITGPKCREWGFLCPQGWRHWVEFTGGPDGEMMGPGCD